MQRIFESANKPFNVFLFFCSLIGTVNNQTKEWHMSQDEMISLWGYVGGVQKFLYPSEKYSYSLREI